MWTQLEAVFLGLSFCNERICWRTGACCLDSRLLREELAPRSIWSREASLSCEAQTRPEPQSSSPGRRNLQTWLEGIWHIVNGNQIGGSNGNSTFQSRDLTAVIKTCMARKEFVAAALRKVFQKVLPLEVLSLELRHVGLKNWRPCLTPKTPHASPRRAAV